MAELRLSLVAVAALLVAAAPQAQDARLANAPRVLFAVSDLVKGNDGVYAQIETRITYDPVRGEYLHEMLGADGEVLARVVRTVSVAGPTPTETEVARQLIEAEPEIARLIARAQGEVHIEGGFPLVREDGHPCGPGGRCATYDVWDTTAAGRQRLRYVIVDLRAVRVLDADADPQEDSNLAHPDARRQSRLR